MWFIQPFLVLTCGEGCVDWSWPCIYFPDVELSAHPHLHPPQQTLSWAEQAVALWEVSFWEDRAGTEHRLKERITPTVHKRDKRKWSREKEEKGERREPWGECSRCIGRVDAWVRSLQNAELFIASNSYSQGTWRNPTFLWFNLLDSQHQGEAQVSPEFWQSHFIDREVYIVMIVEAAHISSLMFNFLKTKKAF